MSVLRRPGAVYLLCDEQESEPRGARARPRAGLLVAAVFCLAVAGLAVVAMLRPSSREARARSRPRLSLAAASSAPPRTRVRVAASKQRSRAHALAAAPSQRSLPATSRPRLAAARASRPAAARVRVAGRSSAPQASTLAPASALWQGVVETEAPSWPSQAPVQSQAQAPAWMCVSAVDGVGFER